MITASTPLSFTIMRGFFVADQRVALWKSVDRQNLHVGKVFFKQRL